MGEPHVSSFNYLLKDGLQQAIDDLTPAQFKIGEKCVKLSIKVNFKIIIDLYIDYLINEFLVSNRQALLKWSFKKTVCIKL